MIKFWLYGYEDVTTFYIDDSFNNAFERFVIEFAIPEYLLSDVCYEYLI